MKILGSILILVFLSGFNSCNKINLPASELEAIYGRWQLYATSGGFSGGGIPDLDESKIRIIISSNGEYEEYFDGDLINEMNFEIIDGSEIGAGQDQYFIDFIDLFSEEMFEYMSIYFSGSDTLALSDYCADCINYHYVRIK